MYIILLSNGRPLWAVETTAREIREMNKNEAYESAETWCNKYRKADEKDVYPVAVLNYKDKPWDYKKVLGTGQIN